MNADHYEVLGVRRTATPAEIRRAYQKLARLLHPDLNPGDPAAVDRFGEVSLAFEVLSNPQRRAEYDRGEASPPAPARASEIDLEGFDFSAEVRVGGLDFREIFGALRPQAEPASARGEDIEQVTRVSFEEGFRGTKRTVQLTRFDQCQDCAGRGELMLAPRPCPSCRGTGRVRTSRGRMIFTRACPECLGAGVIGRRACANCDGEGRLMQSEWLEVQIPPGVGNGSRVRVPGAGNAGRRGGAAGDFVLVVETEPHAFYRREGDDLYCKVPITMIEAALGAHVEVPTPDGPMTIEVPAGTQDGQRFRLRKRGVPRPQGGRGDLYVEAELCVPSVTDDASRRLLQEFARLNPHDPRAEQGTLRHAGAKS